MAALTDQQFKWIAYGVGAIFLYTWWKVKDFKLPDEVSTVVDGVKVPIVTIIGEQDKRLIELVKLETGVSPANAAERALILETFPAWARAGGAVTLPAVVYYAYQAGKRVRARRDELTKSGIIFDQWGIK